ncbi:hypothetical protein ACHMW6_16895 [Pseudoduganella sp. UC29_106]|uniref:hypothetical protein n=1 Tax=Pseudoduganella sp. UC29_106 TaxID=3374553 RepID=UPI003757FFE4
MTTIEHVRRNGHAAPSVLTARQLYLLLREQNDREQAHSYLERCLDQASALPCDLPAVPDEWPQWLAQRNRERELQQQSYRDMRTAGTPRRYFASRNEARRFLCNAAPAMLAEGAWLYGVMQHWDVEALQPLVRVYLEYVGKGVPDWNRVLRARQLLAVQGCVQWQEQEDEHFVQGALRLALSCCGDAMLPELLGYHLGVANQPLYRPSVADELRELGIPCYLLEPPAAADQAAIDCLQQLLPHMQDPDSFLQRVCLGYSLHGLGTEPVAAAQDASAASAPGASAAAVPAPAADAEGEQPQEPPVRRREHNPRAVIRHEFPEDEHAWESIDNELGLLEAQVASSPTQEEAMSLLASRLTPALHHVPLGLMAGRIFSQLYEEPPEESA